LSHTGEKSFTCDECGVAFARVHDLRRHARCLHSGDRPYKCTVAECRESYPRADALSRHLRIEHRQK
ncbi:Metallothionein expression activator, partial [Irineochytrium annulatum]